MHIISGDLRIIENEKLRKIVSKGPNYRETRYTLFYENQYNWTLGLLFLKFLDF